MLEVADIVRLHGEAYLRQFGSSLSSVQKRALRDISACRTPLLGGHVYKCGHCQEKIFSYHSCRNRSCPKCHQAQTKRWIDKQRGRLPACSYFLVTFTLPAAATSTGTIPSEENLQPVDESRRRCPSDWRAILHSGRTSRCSGRPSHLDARHAVSSARPHAGHRRRPRTR